MNTSVGVQAGKRQTVWYFCLLALASLIWSGQGIAVKVLDPHLGPIAITFLALLRDHPFVRSAAVAVTATESRAPHRRPQETGSASPSPGLAARCWPNWE